MARRILASTLAAAAALLAQAQLQLPAALQAPVEQALRHNRTIANKQLELEKADLERRTVLNKHLPSVSARAGYAYLDNHAVIDLPGYRLPLTGYELFSGKSTVDSQGNLAHAGITATGLLFSGGQVRNGAKALGARMTGDSLMLELDRDALVAEVVAGFDKLHLVRASELLLEEAGRRLDKEAERVEKAVANGLAVPFDREKIKLARLQLEAKRTELHGNKEMLLQLLVHLTGMSTAEVDAVDYSLQPLAWRETADASGRAELQALQAYQLAGQLAVRKEKGSYLPMVGAFAGVSGTSLFNGSSRFNLSGMPAPLAEPEMKLNELTLGPTWLVGIGLKWDILAGNERRHKVKQAELALEQVGNRLADSREKLDLQLGQKRTAYRTRMRQLDIAEQQEQVAGNGLTLARQQYAQGLISVNDRLAADNDYLQAAQGRVEALVNQRQSALEAWMAAGPIAAGITFQ